MESKKDTHYWRLTGHDTLSLFGSRETGLTAEQVARRLERDGENVLPEGEKVHWIFLVLRQFNSPLIYIILLAAAVSVFVGHISDAIFILIVVLINTVVGFIQEFKAEQSLEELKKTIVQSAVVLRDNHRLEIPIKDVVVGDIVMLSAGDYVPADGRLLVVEDVMVNEVVLTGESAPVKKSHKVLRGEHVSVADQKNMVFAGTHVAEGKAQYVVTATGRDTEIGDIAHLVSQQHTTSQPLEQKFKHLSRVVAMVVIVGIVVFSFIGIARGQALEDIFVMATALVVSAIPEGLLPAVTIVMVFGVRRLARQKALVRKLSATETIGAITTICTDKTGTLTKGEMRVVTAISATGAVRSGLDDREQVIKEEDRLHETILIGAVVNESFREIHEGEIVYRGRPTDSALLRAGYELGVDHERFRNENEEVGRVAFSSARKYAARFFSNEQQDQHRIYIVGAPEVIMARATHFVGEKQLEKIDELPRKTAHALKELTKEGYRVLVCGYRDYDTREKLMAASEKETAIEGYIIAGFIALRDPVRKESAKALEMARRAGIRPIIITGDHATTAQSIARSLDWHVDESAIMTGEVLDDMTEDILRERVQEVELFARVAPRHKIRIVRALQANNEVVAMVGDGVNDAPALKAAHVGISMGNGTEITKSVADIVLLDSSFTTIVGAIRQGRAIFENIRRIILYLVADNFSGLFVFFVAMLFGYPLPLAAAQILWINLIEDSLPNIALTTERDTKGIMDLPPRAPDEPILSRSYKVFMACIFAISGISAVAIFLGVYHLTLDHALAQTMTFALIAFDSLALTFVLRSFRRSVWRRDIFSNKWINYAVLAALALLLCAIYIEPLGKILSTVPLSLGQWGVIVLITIVELVLLEVSRRLIFRTH